MKLCYSLYVIHTMYLFGEPPHHMVVYCVSTIQPCSRKATPHTDLGLQLFDFLLEVVSSSQSIIEVLAHAFSRGRCGFRGGLFAFYGLELDLQLLSLFFFVAKQSLRSLRPTLMLPETTGPRE